MRSALLKFLAVSSQLNLLNTTAANGHLGDGEDATEARGELQKVVKWLRKEGPVDALFPSVPTDGGMASVNLLHTTSGNGHLELVRVLLKRGASVDLPSSLGCRPAGRW